MTPERLYVATGACAGCPHQRRCHEPRQRAVDPIGLGRHTGCGYYQEFERRVRVGRMPRPDWRGRLFARVTAVLRAAR